VRLETIHPKELGPAEVARWRALQCADASLQSPYLSPDWAQLIGAVRDDARVCIIENGDGFFAAQRLSRFAAMGVGAPIADYQAVVSRPDLKVDAAALCRALKVGRIDLTHAPAGATPLTVAGSHGSWIAETSGGRDLYEAGLKQRRSEFVRQTDKKFRKLERERGPMTFRAQSAERADYDTLLGWKNAQLERSGQPRIWATPWVGAVLERCFEARSAQFGGVLFTLSIDDKLVAGAFCLRSAKALNFWIVAHDNTFDSYSPGVLLARWAIGWAAEHGIAEVDFGPGDYQYKRQLSTTQRTLNYGVVAGASFSGVTRRAEYALRASVERLPQARIAALPGKAMRRIDLMRALAA
jgi:CelD/BcsL family acetyltransferase involved in cellulose biosynthesis